MHALLPVTRLDTSELLSHNGDRIEFAVHRDNRRICGFGTLCVVQSPNGASVCSIRRLRSLKNGKFLTEHHPLSPELSRLITFHREPMIATLSLYEP